MKITLRRALVLATSLWMLAGCAPGEQLYEWPDGYVPVFGSGDGTSSPGPWTEPDTSETPKVACESNDECPPELPYCGTSGFCFQCTEDAHCSGEAVCENGYCVAEVCNPGESQCNGSTMLTCKQDGSGWDSFTCPGDNADCVNGACVGCPPGYAQCVAKDLVFLCRADGSGFDLITCESGFCADGECLECYPGNKQCNDTVAQECSLSGMWEDVADCNDVGKECVNGLCQTECGAVGKLSNEGCDYWAVDMDNLGDAADSPYAVIVSNLSDTSTVVTVTAQTGESVGVTSVTEGSVGPGELKIFEMPQKNMGGSGLFWKAIRVQSTGPIVAYQFNPLENVAVYSNDASLLLPANTFGNEYIIVSRFEFLGGADDGVSTIPYRGSFSVVASEANTTVTVSPTVKTRASAPGYGVPGIMPGQSTDITLQPYQVLNIQSDSDGGDLTGTIVTSDKPIGVFGGHQAALGSDQCCADHLEQQLFPTTTWGKTYVASHSMTRGIEKDYWRIVAAQDGTNVIFSPAVHTSLVLDRGEWAEFQTNQDFMIQADKPILVAQTLASSYETVFAVAGAEQGCMSTADCPASLGYTCETVDLIFGTMMCLPPSCNAPGAPGCPNGHTCGCYYDNPPTTCSSDFDCLLGFSGYSSCIGGQCGACGCQPIGDPALILSAPVEQFRDAYVFLSPTNYTEDYINIVAPTGTTVLVDGTTLSGGLFSPVAGSSYSVARLSVSDGVHSIEASQPVGVSVYGYDDDVSYGYTAGLSLSDL